jgi:hypothetical protein
VKAEREFLRTEGMPWRATSTPDVEEKVLSRDEDDPDVLTRLARWAPGLDTSADGVIRHAWAEEVLIVEGSLRDLTLGRTFGGGHFACRPPGMAHGPYRTDEGCVMLEIRYRL